MLGAIIGDIIGSCYEWEPVKTKNIELISSKSEFTDDSVMTIAIADAIMNYQDPVYALKKWGKLYNVGYGPMFKKWLHTSNMGPIGSYGNGSAMRTSAVGWLFDSLSEVLKMAEYYSAVTHNHPEGIKGAQSVSAAIFMARKGSSKLQIKNYIESTFGYDLSRTLDEIRPTYEFDASCQGSVPESIISFLESTDYLDTILNAISLGGDADTMACIAGSIAEAFYGFNGIPNNLIDSAKNILTPNLLEIINEFYSGRKANPLVRDLNDFPNQEDEPKEEGTLVKPLQDLPKEKKKMTEEEFYRSLFDDL